jgi:hypothetical protein
MALIAEMTSASYAVEIPVDKFVLLTERDYKLENVQFDEELMRLGASDIEYNGHYGSYIHFTLTIDEDHEETKDAILAKIEEYINLL